MQFIHKTISLYFTIIAKENEHSINDFQNLNSDQISVVLFIIHFLHINYTSKKMFHFNIYVFLFGETIPSVTWSNYLV